MSEKSFVQVKNILDVQNRNFYFEGKNDHVRCAFCRKAIGNWKDTDRPMIVHEGLFPECLFLRGMNEQLFIN